MADVHPSSRLLRMGYLLDQSGNSLESLFLQFWTKKYPERLEPMTTNFLLTKYQPGCIVPGGLVLYDTTDRIAVVAPFKATQVLAPFQMNQVAKI